MIVRAFDAYNPLYSVWREHGVYNECMRCWENYNETIHQAAAAHNVPIAHVYDAFNGSNHDEDPREKGYIGYDGIHTSDQGKQVIADLLRDLGYEPVAP
jgi:lysophospholipase L1-like esterase